MTGLLQTAVVPMAKRHLGDLARLEAECFSQPWTRAGLAVELESETALFFVCEGEAGEVLGYAGSHLVCGECYVDNVAVFPHCRRLGVGKALMKALIGECVTRNALFVSLEARESNGPALALYSGLGFAQMGQRKQFYEHPQEDALILTKMLT